MNIRFLSHVQSSYIYGISVFHCWPQILKIVYVGMAPSLGHTYWTPYTGWETEGVCHTFSWNGCVHFWGVAESLHFLCKSITYTNPNWLGGTMYVSCLSYLGIPWKRCCHQLLQSTSLPVFSVLMLTYQLSILS